MPTPVDHRDVTVVVHPPQPAAPTTSVVVYDLAYVGDTDGQLFEEHVVDTNNADATFRQIRVLENGALVADVRAYFKFERFVGNGEVATKALDQLGAPQPPVVPNRLPARPAATAARFRWASAVAEVELQLEASTDKGAATVVVYPKNNNRWGVTVARARDNHTLATGTLVLPPGLNLQ